jgi:hypothetical protein
VIVTSELVSCAVAASDRRHGPLLTAVTVTSGPFTPASCQRTLTGVMDPDGIGDGVAPWPAEHPAAAKATRTTANKRHLMV